MTKRTSVQAFVLCALLGAPLAAQNPGDLSLLRAAASEIRNSAQPDSTIYLDPRVMPSSRNHPPAALAALVEVLGVRVATSEEVIKCPRGTFLCHFVKGSLLISFAEPTVTRDSASLRVRLDKASSERRMPVISEDILLILVRQRGGDWKVVERRRERIT